MPKRKVEPWQRARPQRYESKAFRALQTYWFAHDENGKPEVGQYAALANMMTFELYETANREGFA